MKSCDARSSSLNLLKRAAGFVLIGMSTSALVACGGAEPQASPPAFEAQAQLSPELQQRYDSTCGVCHGVAGTGAPAAGDMAEWEERGKQGIDALLDHAISGYRGMPPMGMCMECSQEDLQAMIKYMSGLECD